MPTPLSLTLTVNGAPRPVSVQDDTEPLLFVLRNQCDQKGPKLGCGVAQCGSCTVLIDGAIARSCVRQIKTVAAGAKIATLDGLTDPQRRRRDRDSRDHGDDDRDRGGNRPQGDHQGASALGRGPDDGGDRRNGHDAEDDRDNRGRQDDDLEGLHPLQRAFVQLQAAQCATCINGMIMGALGWLQGRIAAGNRSVPTDDEVKNFLTGVGQDPAWVYLCRCGAHPRIVNAIQSAAREMR